MSVAGYCSAPAKQHLARLGLYKLHPALHIIAESQLGVLEEEPGLAGQGVERLAELVMLMMDRAGSRVGGVNFYWPKGVFIAMDERNMQIVREFNGKNIMELALKYGVTDVRIKQIIAAYREAQFNERQGRIEF